MLTDTEKAALERAAAHCDKTVALLDLMLSRRSGSTFDASNAVARDQAVADAVTLRALIERAGWQPIETAPRDWEDVLVFSPEHEGFNCRGVFSAFCDGKGWFTHMPQGNMRLNPTRWQPLPTPPTDVKGDV